MEDVNRLAHMLMHEILFMGYGLYTLAWVIASLFYRKNDFLSRLDKAANRLIAVCGLVYLVFWLIWFFSTIYSNDIAAADSLLRRLTGKYGYTIWLPVVVWAGVSQLFWFSKVRRLLLVRFLQVLHFWASGCYMSAL